MLIEFLPRNARRIAKLLLPPIVVRALQAIDRRLRRGDDALTYAPDGWQTGLSSQHVYETESIVRAEHERWKKFVRTLLNDTAPVTDGCAWYDSAYEAIEDHNTYMTFAYVLALASRARKRLRVLDYGSSVGHCYWLARALLEDVELDYHCKELPGMAAEGRRANPHCTWHVDDACLDLEFDLVIFSSSLQYIPEWRKVLRRAAYASSRYLFLTQVPTVERAPSFVAVQRLEGAEALHLLVNRQELLDTVESAGVRLVREFLISTHGEVRKAPEQPFYRAFLFRKEKARAELERC